MYDVFDVLGDEPEAVEADLIHHYPGYGPGGPLAAFWQGRISLRLLRILVERLPPTSALARAVRGTHWSTTDYHLADISDELATLKTAFLNVHREEGRSPLPWPDRAWRPGDPVPRDQAEDAEAKREQAKATYERVLAQVMPPKGE